MKSKKKYRSVMLMAMRDMAEDNKRKREIGQSAPGILEDLLLSKEITALNRELGLHRINKKH